MAGEGLGEGFEVAAVGWSRMCVMADATTRVRARARPRAAGPRGRRPSWVGGRQEIAAREEQSCVLERGGGASGVSEVGEGKGERGAQVEYGRGEVGEGGRMRESRCGGGCAGMGEAGAGGGRVLDRLE